MSSLWLDQDYYLQQELSLIQELNPDSSITTTQALLTALSEEGKTVEQHFVESGWKEGLDPSAGFDVSYYLSEVADATGLSTSAVKMLMEASGIDPVTHYELFGAAMGLDPSEYFDTSYYAEQKAELLNKEAFMGKTDWTSDDAIKLMVVTGSDPLTDYQHFGWLQDLSPIDGFDNDSFYDRVASGTTLLSSDQIPLFLAMAGTDPLSYILTYGLPDTSDDSSTTTTDSTSTSTTTTTDSTSTSSTTTSATHYAQADASDILHLSGSWSDASIVLGDSPTVSDGSTTVSIVDSNGTSHSGTITKIDLSGFTYDTHITGSSYGDEITGGSGNDIINSGKGHDILIGGDGQDTFVFHGITSDADANVISDFTAGSSGDILQFDTDTYSSYKSGSAHIDNAADVAKATTWDNYVIVDTFDNIASLNVSTLTDHHAVLAIASDTGDIIYDADGDFSSGMTLIGGLPPSEVSLLTTHNIDFV